MAYGKSIELFLVNGTADSLVTAELSNGNGTAIKIPRIEVSSCDRNDIKQLADFFATNYPELKGFNRRGLYRMKQFYELYKDNEKVSTLLA